MFMCQLAFVRLCMCADLCDILYVITHEGSEVVFLLLDLLNVLFIPPQEATIPGWVE